jgi:hypothetical protein
VIGRCQLQELLGAVSVPCRTRPGGGGLKDDGSPDSHRDHNVTRPEHGRGFLLILFCRSVALKDYRPDLGPLSSTPGLRTLIATIPAPRLCHHGIPTSEECGTSLFPGGKCLLPRQ